MRKSEYTGVKLTISRFEPEEVFTASSAEIPTRDPDKPVELPFVPVE